MFKDKSIHNLSNTVWGNRVLNYTVMELPNWIIIAMFFFVCNLTPINTVNYFAFLLRQFDIPGAKKI